MELVKFFEYKKTITLVGGTEKDVRKAKKKTNKIFYTYIDIRGIYVIWI